MNKVFLIALLVVFSCGSFAKEIALAFDDAPVGSSPHFESSKRTAELIKKLKSLKVQGAMIFANPCKDEKNAVSQLRKYIEAGHTIANHTCSYTRLDDVGFFKFSGDAEQADKRLGSLFNGQKFFRFPYLNESQDEKLRDQMRSWLKDNQYRNAMVSVDNDDYIVSWAINKAKKSEKNFLDHLLGAIEFYDNLAVKQLGYSPKHVILLHEVDATVMFIDSLVNELRERAWKIITAKEAYEDKLYFM